MRPTRRTQPHRRKRGRVKSEAVQAMMKGRSALGANRSDLERAAQRARRRKGRRRRRASSVRR